MTKLITFRCPRCGGDSVGHDANSVWCDTAQDWVLGSSFDDAWCNDCGDIKLEYRPLTRAERQERRARIAAHPVSQLLAAAGEADAALTRALALLEGPSPSINSARAALRKSVAQTRKLNIGAL